jgi:Tfp pilus assembly protein PilE
MEKKNNTFEYTYSASQQEEIKKIRDKYMIKTQAESKIEQLQKLDKKAENSGLIISIGLGIIGTLIFGAGMSLALVWAKFMWGIVTGVVGIIMLAMAYPSYKYITKKERQKVTPQVLKLIEELEQGK